MSEIAGYEPDFIERNGTWLLSLVGIMVTCFSGLLAFFLKRRCQTIKCCGCECQRDVLNLERVPAEQLKVELDKRQSPDTLAPAVADAVPSLVTQALRFPRRKRPSVPVEVELPTTNSESV
eukprot:5798170-Prymnesium_polylepis.2